MSFFPSSSDCQANLANLLPAAVSDIFPCWLLTSRISSSFSNYEICCETAGWVINNCLAVLVYELFLARIANVKKRLSIINFSYKYGLYKQNKY